MPHYWSPALVGFFGFGGGVGFGAGFGFGNIGWVPLAPYEVLHPWWGRGYYGSAGYVNRSMNIANVNVRNYYQNARVTNGVTGFSVHDFQNGRASNIVRPTAAQFASAGMIRGAVPLAAGSGATRFSSRAASYAPRNSGRTTFFHSPQARGMASQGGVNRSSSQTGMAARSSGSSGFAGGNRFGAPGTQSTRPASSSSGWQRFGQPNPGYRNSQYSGSSPRYNAPSQPRSAPAYNAPRSSSGGASRPASGGGSGHAGSGHSGGGSGGSHR